MYNYNLQRLSEKARVYYKTKNPKYKNVLTRHYRNKHIVNKYKGMKIVTYYIIGKVYKELTQIWINSET